MGDPAVTEIKALKEVVGTSSCLFLSLLPGHEVGSLDPTRFHSGALPQAQATVTELASSQLPWSPSLPSKVGDVVDGTLLTPFSLLFAAQGMAGFGKQLLGEWFMAACFSRHGNAVASPWGLTSPCLLTSQALITFLREG